MNVFRTIAARLPHDHLVAFVIPLENRARTYAQPLPNFCGNGELTLSRELRMRYRHSHRYYHGNELGRVRRLWCTTNPAQV